MNGRRVHGWLIAVAALSVCAASRVGRADTCVSNGANETEVCLSWSQATDPVAGVDFTFVYIDDFSPAVTLITGDPAWNIIVTNVQSQTPGNLVSLDIAPTSSVANFGVSLDNGFSPAAADVGVIDLRAPTMLAVRSSFGGGQISGDLEGLYVQRSAFGVGGELNGDFYMAGRLQGDISAAKLVDSWFIVGGDQSGDITLSDRMTDANLTVSGDTSSASTITIPRWSGSSVDLADAGFSVPTEFDGTLILGDGVPADCDVRLAGQLGGAGVIDLSGADVESFLELGGGGAGSIINGGTVTGSGHVWVSTLEENVFTGMATFAGMDAFSAVEAEYSNIDGVINILGDMNGQLWVRVGPLLENGVFNIGGDIGSTGSIVVHSVTGFGGDVFGKISVGGSIKGQMYIDHNVHGLIEAKSINGGLIDIADDLTGIVATGKIANASISVGGNLSGSLTGATLADSFAWVAGDVSGELAIPGSLLGASVAIGQNVTASGELMFGPLNVSLGGYSSVIDISQGEIGEYDMAGLLTLLGGVADGSNVSCRAEITSTGIVDLNHGGVAGYADFAGGGAGLFINGGTIATTGHLWLGGSHVSTWSGYASFDEIDDWGVIETEAAHIDGTIEVAGDVNGYLVARFGDLGPNTNLIVGGSVQNLGTVGSLGYAGSFGHCAGNIKVHGDVLGQILVGDELESTGHIDVDGAMKGHIIVNAGTQSGSSIEIGGLAVGSYLTINDSQGAYNADGNVIVSGPGTAVEFDGCIRVREDTAGGSGDLNGRILVTGCHATPDDLNICIDGNVNGAVTIRQTGCRTQVGWSCTAQCP